jgi:hypothetical protein
LVYSANQGVIKKNQSSLREILANQKEILANQKTILAGLSKKSLKGANAVPARQERS